MPEKEKSRVDGKGKAACGCGCLGTSGASPKRVKPAEKKPKK